MGTVTSERETPSKFYSQVAHPLAPGTPTWGPVEFYSILGLPVPVQTTTSYRTGGIAEDPLSNEEDSVAFGNTSQADFHQRLAEVTNYVPENSNPADNGHEFDTVRRSVALSHPAQSGSFTDFELWSGPVGPGRLNWGRFGHNEVHGPFNMGYYGPECVRRTKPDGREVDLTVALGEFRLEGIPDLLGGQLLERKVIEARAAGSEFLNVQFGWRPIVDSLRQAATAVIRSNNLIKQRQRDSGRSIRRRLVFPLTSSTESFGPVPGQLHNPTYTSDWTRLFEGRNTQGSLITSTTLEERVSFSGAFQYHLEFPKGALNDLENQAKAAQQLLGIRFTPDAVWNLTPWSWLADWNGNVGSILANASSFGEDNLVLRYGYLMRETLTYETGTLYGPVLLDGTTGPWSTTFVTRRKQRFKAAPYGFGSNPQTYTSAQWAILAALGLTSAPNTLKVSNRPSAPKSRRLRKRFR